MQFLGSHEIKIGQIVKMTTGYKSAPMTVATIEKRTKDYQIIGFSDGLTVSGQLNNVFTFIGVDTRSEQQLADLYNGRNNEWISA